MAHLPDDPAWLRRDLTYVCLGRIFFAWQKIILDFLKAWLYCARIADYT
jgi:hypothetical protein